LSGGAAGCAVQPGVRVGPKSVAGVDVASGALLGTGKARILRRPGKTEHQE
jgi:hypothetical protein